ncbi:hypothetical protein L2E82_49786 [Cichorium intybus]|uniref:Uncharacterized protein n=1 Tax=Cichorium intybus TaxID=13427 RepID=A0ACB8Z0V7_CICIN|nr:hypothetical protein L2E82_49786 [Cichorium intybus]
MENRGIRGEGCGHRDLVRGCLGVRFGTACYCSLLVLDVDYIYEASIGNLNFLLYCSILSIDLKTSPTKWYQRVVFVFNGPVQNDLEVETTDYVIVCDICGDVGREDLLAICSTCKDGAENTYCMKLMINEVPRGDWQCEECKSSEELNCPNYDKKVSTGSNHINAEMGQMFDVLNEGKGRIPKTPSKEVQTKEKPKEFADEQETN